MPRSRFGVAERNVPWQQSDLNERGRMRAGVIAGIALIVLGALALAYQGFSFTREREIVDIGPIEATAEERETVPIPPILGGLAIVAGVVLILVGRRASERR